MKGRQSPMYSRRHDSDCSLPVEMFELESSGNPVGRHFDPFCDSQRVAIIDDDDLPVEMITHPISPCSGSSSSPDDLCGSPNTEELPPAYCQTPPEHSVGRRSSFSRVRFEKNRIVSQQFCNKNNNKQSQEPQPLHSTVSFGFSKSAFMRRHHSVTGICKRTSVMSGASAADSCLSASYIHDGDAMARYGSILLSNCQHAEETDSPLLSRTVSECSFDLDATVITLPQMADDNPSQFCDDDDDDDDDDDMEVEVLNITM